MSSTPDQFDDWYDDEHNSSEEVELEDDVDDQDTGQYNCTYSGL